MRYLRLIWRLLVFGWLTFDVVFRIFIRARFLGTKRPEILRMRRRWARRLLPAVGVQITQFGQPPELPCLLVSNHRSYLDPIVVLCETDAFPVSKAEVEKWPLIGYGAKMAGMLYLKRNNTGKRASILRAMEQTIKSGYPVLLFPEGTTSDLNGVLPFKLPAFVRAVKEQLPVAPIALRFGDPRDYWVLQESFLTHAARRFGEPEIRVEIHYGPIMHSENPEELLNLCRNWIEAIVRDPDQN
ncbi:MAG: lysophospholipid acyltransferase family protein [Saprospiraceae bacterium]